MAECYVVLVKVALLCRYTSQRIALLTQRLMPLGKIHRWKRRLCPSLIGWRKRREGTIKRGLDWRQEHNAFGLLFLLLLLLMLLIHLCNLSWCYYGWPLSTRLDQIESDLMKLKDRQEEVLDVIIVRRFLEFKAFDVIEGLSELLGKIIEDQGYYCWGRFRPQDIISCVCPFQAPR